MLDWLAVKLDLGKPVGVERYSQDIHNETRKYVREEWTAPSNLPTIESWVCRGTWMRRKAGTGDIGDIHIEGKRRRTRRYKDLDAVTTVIPEEMVVIQKSEGAKIRPEDGLLVRGTRGGVKEFEEQYFVCRNTRGNEELAVYDQRGWRQATVQGPPRSRRV